MKLDFICIGAQKAGTTTLHDILKQHPDIYLPPNKEAQFVDVNEFYEKGVEFYFDTLYNTYKNEKFVGNINPNLQLENRSIDRLLNCFGIDLKFIFILRDPVDRAYSHYLMSKRRGFETLSFMEAVEKESYRIANPQKHSQYRTQEAAHYEKNHFGYIYRSQYLRTIQYLLTKVPHHNVKFMLFEDFVADKAENIKDILHFLKIPQSTMVRFAMKSNPASAPRNAWVRDFISKSNPVKNIFNKLFPKKVKTKLKNSINALNNKPLEQKEKMVSPLDRQLIYQTYFKREIKEIEELININCREKWGY